MSSLLSSVLFASAAAAQITTSIWLPSSPSGADNVEFHASVVGADGDKLTLAVELNAEDYEGNATEMITFLGSSAFENIVTTTDSYGDYPGDLTLSYGCSKQGNRPVCAYSSNGPAAWSAYCNDYTDHTEIVTSTETYTFDSTSSVMEHVETYDYRDQVPQFCLTGSLLPESYVIQTILVQSDQIAAYAVTITAGEEMLSATAGATPTNSGASATRTPSVRPTGSPSGGNSTVPTSSPTAPVEQTGAAASMAALAPALACLGALVAALL